MCCNNNDNDNDNDDNDDDDNDDNDDDNDVDNDNENENDNSDNHNYNNDKSGDDHNQTSDHNTNIDIQINEGDDIQNHERIPDMSLHPAPMSVIDPRSLWRVGEEGREDISIVAQSFSSATRSSLALLWDKWRVGGLEAALLPPPVTRGNKWQKSSLCSAVHLALQQAWALHVRAAPAGSAGEGGGSEGDCSTASFAEEAVCRFFNNGKTIGECLLVWAEGALTNDINRIAAEVLHPLQTQHRMPDDRKRSMGEVLRLCHHLQDIASAFGQMCAELLTADCSLLGSVWGSALLYEKRAASH